MLAPSSDTVITRSLRLYGEWAEHELSILHGFITSGSTVVDVGANIGTHTLAFSRWVGDGTVIAIEVQPALADILRRNCIQNARRNVDIVNALCAQYPGSASVRINYMHEDNIGAISFADAGRRGWLAGLLDRIWTSRTAHVPAVKLDDICAKHDVSLVKIDVEGMELDVLRGGQNTLSTCRPTLFFEQNDTTRLPDTYDHLAAAGYRMFWLETHPYNQNNFRGVKDNIWWRTETGILALPRERPPPWSFREVRRDDTSPPHQLNAREGTAVASIT